MSPAKGGASVHDETDRYLSAAEQAGTWLVGLGEDRVVGRTWPAISGGEVALSLGWGALGPILFFVDALRATGDERWVVEAKEGGRWIEAEVAGTDLGSASYGLHTGLAGAAFVLDELADATGDDRSAEAATTTVRVILDGAVREGAGVHWQGFTEVMWGTAGIGCMLLDTGRRHVGDRALDAAVAGGRWLLSVAEEQPIGMRWSLGPGVSVLGRPALMTKRFPNFAHGTAGIAFFLARLAAATGDDAFLDAALAGADWVLSTCKTDDGTCAAYHHEPDATDEYTLGWCHGPPGLGWLFRQLELVTGDGVWRDRTLAAAKAVLRSGIPERREPGFWDNVARCCGSAGVAEFFLDLHTLTGDSTYLAFARHMVDDLLEHALVVDDQGMRWSNIEFRVQPPELPPETTYMQGASGIGSTLLRLHRHLGGDEWVVPWPHAPTWTPSLV